MITKSGFDGRKIDTARRRYVALRYINLAGGRALEAHERVALLTVPAGLQPFCFLTHIEEADYYLAVAVLPNFGLYCAVCEVKFCRDLNVDLPQDVIDAFNAYEARSPLKGLGVATSRIDFSSDGVGLLWATPSAARTWTNAQRPMIAQSLFGSSSKQRAAISQRSRTLWRRERHFQTAARKCERLGTDASIVPGSCSHLRCTPLATSASTAA